MVRTPDDDQNHGRGTCSVKMIAKQLQILKLSTDIDNNIDNFLSDIEPLTKFKAPPLEAGFGDGPQCGQVGVVHDHQASFSAIAPPLNFV